MRGSSRGKDASVARILHCCLSEPVPGDRLCTCLVALLASGGSIICGPAGVKVVDRVPLVIKEGRLLCASRLEHGHPPPIHLRLEGLTTLLLPRSSMQKLWRCMRATIRGARDSNLWVRGRQRTPHRRMRIPKEHSMGMRLELW